MEPLFLFRSFFEASTNVKGGTSYRLKPISYQLSVFSGAIRASSSPQRPGVKVVHNQLYSTRPGHVQGGRGIHVHPLSLLQSEGIDQVSVAVLAASFCNIGPC